MTYFVILVEVVEEKVVLTQWLQRMKKVSFYNIVSVFGSLKTVTKRAVNNKSTAECFLANLDF